MSRRALTLPLRTLSAAPRAQAERWTCRRCLATQSMDTPSVPPTTTPLDPAQTTTTSTTIEPVSQDSERATSVSKMARSQLDQSISPSLLMHIDPSQLAGHDREVREHLHVHKEIIGVVVRTGRMEKTVSVRVPGRRWEPRVKKHFVQNTTHLVHDPNSSLRQGDVVSLHRQRSSTAVRHVIASIITPFGTPASARPPVPTPEERLAAYKSYRQTKLARRTLRREAASGNPEAIAELKHQGLDPGAGVKEGKGRDFGTEKGVGKRRTPKEGAILGKKGQKLPEGVLPGGKHEVGKIDQRAKRNKEVAMKRDEKAKENLLEAKERTEELESRGLEGGKGT